MFCAVALMFVCFVCLAQLGRQTDGQADRRAG